MSTKQPKPEDTKPQEPKPLTSPLGGMVNSKGPAKVQVDPTKL